MSFEYDLQYLNEKSYETFLELINSDKCNQDVILLIWDMKQIDSEIGYICICYILIFSLSNFS